MIKNSINNSPNQFSKSFNIVDYLWKNYNSKNKIISEKEFNNLLKKLDLKHLNKYGDSCLNLIFRNNTILNLPSSYFDYLIENSDINNFDSTSKNLLFFVLINNKMKKLNLSNNQLDYLIKNTNLNTINHDQASPLIYAFLFNKAENLNLTDQQFNYLIKNSNLNQVDMGDFNSLMTALITNKSEKLNLSNENWLYLIDNSNLLQNSKTTHNSVLGLAIEFEPSLVDLIFPKIIKNKDFNPADYANDKNFLKIKEMYQSHLTKDQINQQIKKADTSSFSKQAKL